MDNRMKHALDDLFAARGRRAEAQFGGPATPRSEPLISLAYGLADPALFPRAELLAATAELGPISRASTLFGRPPLGKA